MYILVCNVGSTSLKFKLFNMPDDKHLCDAKIERVGSTDDAIFQYKGKNGCSVTLEKQSIPSYTAGIQLFLSYLTHPEHGVIADLGLLERIGFKTVLAKGYYGVHLLDDLVLDAMEEYLPIAPVHNSCYLEAIRQFQDILPETPMVGVFETMFHTTIPLERRLYALPYEWYEEYGIQRFGYHGASHSYIAEQIALAEGPQRRVISCHLGGSCSLSAIKDGKCLDNSFGFSLQTGIFHSNRVGDVDIYVWPFLRQKGMSDDEIIVGLEKQGGFLGISGVSNDMRYVEDAMAEGDERAALAVEMFADQIVRYIGSYYVFLSGLDDLVFTGGIGEKGSDFRKKVCDKIKCLGVSLDDEANMQKPVPKIISANDSAVKVHVITANEELVVAQKTYALEL